MKKIKTLLLVGLLSITLGSCEKNEIFYFDLNEQPALNIWFGTMSNAATSTGDITTDSVVHNYFFQHNGTKDTIIFHARLVGGVPADHDRTFTLEATSGNLTRANVEIGNFVLRQGQHQASFPIVFDKPAGGIGFTTDGEVLMLKLKEPNEHFKAGFAERRYLHVVVRNATARPDNWDVAYNAFSQRLSTYFGVYSDVKHAFVVQTIGRPLNFNVTPSAQGNVPGMDNLPNFQAEFYRDMMRHALKTYNDANPTNPMRDENNDLITFP